MAQNTIINQLSLQITNFANVYMMKYINTGDRILDTSIQIIISTIFTSLIACVVIFFTDPTIIYEYKNRLFCILRPSKYDPLKFNPSMAPSTMRNGVSYLYSFGPMKDYNCMSWFILYHRDKMFTQKISRPIERFQPSIIESIHDRDKNCYIASPDLLSTFTQSYLPVWRHKNGYYVFLKVIANGTYKCNFYSDSGEAIEEVIKHYYKHSDKINELLCRTTVLKIYSHNNASLINGNSWSSASSCMKNSLRNSYVLVTISLVLITASPIFSLI